MSFMCSHSKLPLEISHLASYDLSKCRSWPSSPDPPTTAPDTPFWQLPTLKLRSRSYQEVTLLRTCYDHCKDSLWRPCNSYQLLKIFPWRDFSDHFTLASVDRDWAGWSGLVWQDSWSHILSHSTPTTQLNNIKPLSNNYTNTLSTTILRFLCLTSHCIVHILGQSQPGAANSRQDQKY